MVEYSLVLQMTGSSVGLSVRAEAADAPELHEAL